QALGTQALALALPARGRRHILLEPFAVAFRGRLAIPAVEEWNHSGKDRLGARVLRILTHQNQVLNLARKLVERRLEVELILLGGAHQASAQDRGAGAGAQSALPQLPDHAGPNEGVGGQGFNEVFEFALAAPHYGGEDHDAVAGASSEFGVRSSEFGARGFLISDF